MQIEHPLQRWRLRNLATCKKMWRGKFSTKMQEFYAGRNHQGSIYLQMRTGSSENLIRMRPSVFHRLAMKTLSSSWIPRITTIKSMTYCTLTHIRIVPRNPMIKNLIPKSNKTAHLRALLPRLYELPKITKNSTPETYPIILPNRSNILDPL